MSRGDLDNVQDMKEFRRRRRVRHAGMRTCAAAE
jgi:hypothetical protein